MRIEGTEANFINTTKTISTHTATEQHARVHRHIEIDMHASMVHTHRRADKYILVRRLGLHRGEQGFDSQLCRRGHTVVIKLLNLNGISITIAFYCVKQTTDLA